MLTEDRVPQLTGGAISLANEAFFVDVRQCRWIERL